VRICYYFRKLNDGLGPGVHARSLVSAWIDSGHSVLCVPHAMSCSPPGGTMTVRRLLSRGLPPSARHRLRQSQAECRSWYETERVVRRIMDFRPDILFARWSQFDHTLDKVLYTVTCPVIAEVNAVIHDEIWRMQGIRLPASQARRELAYLRRADFLVCVSQEVQDRLAGLGIPRVRSAVVPNGVDTELFTPQVAPHEAVRVWADGKLLLAYCGVPALVHDPRTLLRATERIADSFADARFLFVGPLEAEVAPLLSARPDLIGRTHVTGAVPHEMVPALLAPATILWAAYANTYGSPLKQLEYMAMGKPVVVAGTGQAADLVAAPACGRAVPLGDDEGLAGAARDILLLAPDERAVLGGRGRTWVEQNATWSATAESILAHVRNSAAVFSQQSASPPH